MLLLLLSPALATSLAPWQIAWNSAATALNAGDADRCLSYIPEAPSTQPHTEAWLDLGYTCAVAASDLDRADHYRVLLGSHYQPRAALDIHHAWLKRASGEPEAALALLIPGGWTLPHQEAVGRTLELTLLTDIGAWDEAYALAFAPTIDPKAQAALAGHLTRLGRTQEALLLLAQACPSLSHPEVWGCASLLPLPADSSLAEVHGG